MNEMAAKFSREAKDRPTDGRFTLLAMGFID